MLPINGKNGYMKWDGLELPIYFWGMNAVNSRSSFRLANSQNYPVRNMGITSEDISIRGVDYVPIFLSSPTFLTTMIFEIGWTDFTTTLRRKIDVSAMVREYMVTLNYMNSNLPSFMWTTNFIGNLADKEFDVENLVVNDRTVCQTAFCNKLITTTDTTLNGGFVRHVKTANLSTALERPLLVLSNSNNHYAETIGVFDSLIELTVEGDFDYWIDAVNSESKFNYRFFYSGSASFSMFNMKVLDVTNLTVNVQTAEIVSAIVRLGASYG